MEAKMKIKSRDFLRKVIADSKKCAAALEEMSKGEQGIVKKTYLQAAFKIRDINFALKEMYNAKEPVESTGREETCPEPDPRLVRFWRDA